MDALAAVLRGLLRPMLDVSFMTSRMGSVIDGAMCYECICIQAYTTPATGIMFIEGGGRLVDVCYVLGTMECRFMVAVV